MRQKLIVFVKAPRPGFVKTRLAQAIGPTAACNAYRSLVDRVLTQMRSLHEVELRFSPDDSLAEIKPWLQPHWQAAPQGEGSLGERLARAFSDAFTEGCTRVVAIGSDCPDVTANDVTNAWDALERNDVVLGPASDGGYWLIGLRERSDGVFEQIDWSTSRVFEQTMRWIKANDKSHQLLRQLADIDTEEDWKLYLQRGSKLPA